MTFRSFILLLLPVLAMALATVACTKDPSFAGLTGESRPTVPVTLNLAVSSLEMPDLVGHNGKTKTVFDPDIDGASAGTNDEIKTLLLLQFEWQDADHEEAARLIGQQFIQFGSGAASLISSEAKNTVLIVANAWGKTPVVLGTTLGAFFSEQNANLLDALDELTGKGIWYTGGTDTYLRMSGSIVLNKVEASTTIGDAMNPMQLRRNCAKVVINVRNSSSGSVTIENVQLCDINRKYYYVTDHTRFTDSYSATNPARFNKAEEDFPAAYNTSGDTQTYTYYVPVNLRGTITNNSQKDKSLLAPQGATRFVIYAHDDTSQPVFYTYYLGANLKDDFNLLPNHKYTYNIEINGKGNADTDGRIEDMGNVVFTKDANCYMLRPPASRDGHDYTRDFSIPVRRAAVFWNECGTNMGVYGACNSMLAYTLNETDTWEAFFVWNEITDKNGAAVADNALLVTKTGTGFDPNHAGSQPYIKLRIADGMKGNALIAIKKTTAGKTNDDILWSWHLWVTDYDPYIAWTKKADKYFYAVPGGDIHRYAGSTWTSAEYDNAFMMDRNLGARSNYGTGTTSYGLYYQWGRKDPFKTDGNVSTIAADSTNEPPPGVALKMNIRYSVHNPGVYIIRGAGSDSWTSYDDGSNTLGSWSGAWSDHKASLHAEEGANKDNCEQGKSIYDPCPYGWRVPAIGTWSDFSMATTAWLPSSPGRYYYPDGGSSGSVYYPAVGYRARMNGSVCESGVGGQGAYWSSSLRSSSEQYYWYFTSSAMDPSRYNAHRATALPVRCIRLNYNKPY